MLVRAQPNLSEVVGELCRNQIRNIEESSRILPADQVRGIPRLCRQVSDPPETVPIKSRGLGDKTVEAQGDAGMRVL